MKSLFEVVKREKVPGTDKLWAVKWKEENGCDLGENYEVLTDYSERILKEMFVSVDEKEREEVGCYHVDTALMCKGYTHIRGAGFRFTTKAEALEAKRVADRAAALTHVDYKPEWMIEALSRGWSPPEE
jgi:hypothetical protein